MLSFFLFLAVFLFGALLCIKFSPQSHAIENMVHVFGDEILIENPALNEQD